MPENYGMTVAELIEQLKQCPQDAKVFFECEDQWNVTRCETRNYACEADPCVYLTAN